MHLPSQLYYSYYRMSKKGLCLILHLQTRKGPQGIAFSRLDSTPGSHRVVYAHARVCKIELVSCGAYVYTILRITKNNANTYDII